MALKIASSFLTKKYKATYALATYECFPIFHLWTVCWEMMVCFPIWAWEGAMSTKEAIWTGSLRTQGLVSELHLRRWRLAAVAEAIPVHHRGGALPLSQFSGLRVAYLSICGPWSGGARLDALGWCL
jgi:hypothetical protein